MINSFKMFLLSLCQNIFIISILSVPAYTQSDYFVRVIPAPRDGDLAWSVTVCKDGYVFSTGTYCYEEDIECTKVGKVDLEGNLLWYNRYVRIPQFGGGIVTNSENSIYVSGDYFYPWPGGDPYVNVKPYIMKLNQDGDSLWVKTYPEIQNANSTIQSESLGIKYFKNYLYLSGYFFDSALPNSQYIYVTKLDTNGVVLWKRKLNTHQIPKTTLGNVNNYLQVDEAENVMFCFTVDSLSPFFKIPYQVILNKDGDIISEQHLYPLELDNYIANGTSLSSIRGAFTDDHQTVWISPYDTMVGNDEFLVYSFDRNFQKIWRKRIYAHAEAIDNPKLNKWSNSDFIGLYYTNERPINNHWGFGLLRISKNGEFKWKRRYYMHPWKLSSPVELYFAHIAETNDGGIIASGYVYLKNQWKEIEDDVLLVKLDSLGCPYKNCALTDTIIILQESLTDVKNGYSKDPFSWSVSNNQSQLQITFDENIKKPDLVILLTDINGRSLNQKKLKSYENNLDFQIGDLPHGIYCINMNAGKVIKGFKFIK